MLIKNQPNKIKYDVRKVLALGVFTVGISIAASVPVTNRIIYQNSYRVDNVLHISDPITENLIIHFVAWTYMSGDYKYIESILYLNDDHPNLTELANGDTLIKRIKQKATLFDLAYSAILRHPISSFYKRVAEYNVIKNLDDIVPLNVI